MNEKGVFRELTLYSNGVEPDLEALSYQEIHAIELSNSAALDYRLSRFKPAVVFVWGVSGLSKSMLFHLQDKGIPVVYDIHNEWLKPDIYQKDPWYWWWRKNTKFSARWRKCRMLFLGGRSRILNKIPARNAENLNLNHAVVSSHLLRDALIADGLSPLKESIVHYPALHPNVVLKKKRYTKQRRFIWAGRVTEDKAPDLAVRAVELLNDRGIRISLDIFAMGEPIERKIMRERIDKAGLSDQVHMVGIRPGELGTYYAKYDALLFTSRSDDPFPITPLEAMYAGLPCILPKDGGIGEIVEDGETALMFERDDPESLVAAILRFLALPDAGKILADQCIDKLQNSYSMDHYIDKVESILGAAISPDS